MYRVPTGYSAFDTVPIELSAAKLMKFFVTGKSPQDVGIYLCNEVSFYNHNSGRKPSMTVCFQKRRIETYIAINYKYCTRRRLYHVLVMNVTEVYIICIIRPVCSAEQCEPQFYYMGFNFIFSYGYSGNIWLIDNYLKVAR